MKTILTIASILIIALMIHLANGIKPVENERPTLDFPIIESPEVCEDVPIRQPGGMSHSVALVCVGEYGDYISSEAGWLLPDDRQRLIYSVADSLIVVATERGYVVGEIHRNRDRYAGRE